LTRKVKCEIFGAGRAHIAVLEGAGAWWVVEDGVPLVNSGFPVGEGERKSGIGVVLEVIDGVDGRGEPRMLGGWDVGEAEGMSGG